MGAAGVHFRGIDRGLVGKHSFLVTQAKGFLCLGQWPKSLTRAQDLCICPSPSVALTGSGSLGPLRWLGSSFLPKTGVLRPSVLPPLALPGSMAFGIQGGNLEEGN